MPGRGHSRRSDAAKIQLSSSERRANAPFDTRNNNNSNTTFCFRSQSQVPRPSRAARTDTDAQRTTTLKLRSTTIVMTTTRATDGQASTIDRYIARRRCCCCRSITCSGQQRASRPLHKLARAADGQRGRDNSGRTSAGGPNNKTQFRPPVRLPALPLLDSTRLDSIRTTAVPVNNVMSQLDRPKVLRSMRCRAVAAA